MLVAELLEAGLVDARLDEHGYVYASLAATVDDAPVVGLLAHLDTSPDAPGDGVEPLVHRDDMASAAAMLVRLCEAWTTPELRGFRLGAGLSSRARA